MSRFIKVNQPLNLDKNDICRFKNANYELSPLKVFELSNVFITGEGICLINSNLVKESIHGYRDKITIYSLMANLNLLNFDTLLLNDSNYYLLIHSPIFSYYHWLTESLPRLLMAKARIRELTLLLPISLKNVSLVKESLRPFPFKNFFYIPEKANIKVRHIVLPQIKPYFTSYSPEMVNELREFYVEYSKKQYRKENNISDRLFIHDENSHEILNIKEFQLLLDQYKITNINLGDYSFIEQVQIINEAKLVISFGGDEMACINFMKKGSSVLELINNQIYETDQHDLRYLNLASSLDLNYYYQFYTLARNNRIKKQYKINVDSAMLHKNINLILL